MSEYYTARRSRGLYDPARNKPGLEGEPFKLSRSKIDLFLECPRCFYLDRRLGVGRPPGFPFNLNSAVDHLLKKEFDFHRRTQSPHPLMDAYSVEAVPFEHAAMDRWRNTFQGVQCLHEPTNFLVFGAVDDIWVNPAGELIVVDYKATSKDGTPTLDADWQRSYKRQMEIYQWLLRGNDFRVADTGYFVYANGRRDREAFDKKLEFEVVLIPYTGKTEWIDQALIDARALLVADVPPLGGEECDYCAYRHAAGEVLLESKRRATRRPQEAGSRERAVQTLFS
ncbi:MAG: PD-(D/E)XK nuclease family protein [Patescibacteria group bacterium]|nr:PD-(D/E)XK nuclease family protein [Patescibacteria group bacterium]